MRDVRERGEERSAHGLMGHKRVWVQWAWDRFRFKLGLGWNLDGLKFGLDGPGLVGLVLLEVRVLGQIDRSI